MWWGPRHTKLCDTNSVAVTAVLQENRNNIIRDTLEEYAQIAVWTINRDQTGRIVSVTIPEEDIATA